MYVKVTNGQAEIYSIGQLRRDNPNTSFPKNPSESLLAEWGVYPCTVVDRPVYDTLVQYVEQDSPQLVNGIWAIAWLVKQRPLSDAENNVRNHRNDLLQSCDWTQLADASVDSLAWANYRQALRDIPQQAEFPYNVVWPTKPE